MTDANDILMAGGPPSVKFPAIGASVTGTVTGPPKAIQSIDDKTKLPETFPSGDPIMIVIVPLQTEQRDPWAPDDRGERSLWIRGQMMKAVRDAVRSTGANGLEVGGVLTVQYIGDGQKTSNFDPPKQYTAKYVRANPANAALMATPPEAPPSNQGNGYQGNGYNAPPPYAQPAAPPPVVAPYAQPGAYGPNVPMAFLPTAGPVPPAPPGVDPAVWPSTWERLSPDQRQQVMAAAGNVPPF